MKARRIRVTRQGLPKPPKRDVTLTPVPSKHVPPVARRPIPFFHYRLLSVESHSELTLRIVTTFSMPQGAVSSPYTMTANVTMPHYSQIGDTTDYAKVIAYRITHALRGPLLGVVERYSFISFLADALRQNRGAIAGGMGQEDYERLCSAIIAEIRQDLRRYGAVDPWEAEE